MSLGIFLAVQAAEIDSHTHKSILLNLACRVGDSGSGAYSSKDRIAWETGMSKRTVQRGISELIKIGLIFEDGRKTISTGFLPIYGICREALELLPQWGDRATPIPDHMVLHSLDLSLAFDNARKTEGLIQ